MRDPITKMVKQKSGGMQEEVVDPGVEDKRLLIIESELASTLKVMGRDGNTLSPVVRQAWDNKTLCTLTKNSPAMATGAHISILGHITKDELTRYLGDVEAGTLRPDRVSPDAVTVEAFEKPPACPGSGGLLLSLCSVAKGRRLFG